MAHTGNLLEISCNSCTVIFLMVMLCCQFKTVFNIPELTRFYIRTVSCLHFSTLKVFDLAWKEASAKFPVHFLLILTRQKNVLLHMKLCITRATGQEPLGNLVTGFPNKRKKVHVLVQPIVCEEVRTRFYFHIVNQLCNN